MGTSLLEYESQMFLDAFEEDGLLILARGLGVDRMLLNFVKVYCDPASLVLVLNTTAQEEDYFIEQLEGQGVKPLPRVLSAENSANDRQSIYLQGGVLFVSSRILVVDLLTDRVPIERLSGILVYKAHKILESCQEAFILRLYRQKNKTGFIKAFSDNPGAFTTGFYHAERVMKNLFVRKLYLWPRFHADVAECMTKHPVDVVELQLQLTPAMVSCQTAILDLINACVNELKRCTPSVDTDEMTVENALTKSFDKVLRLQLDPVWHQLGPKTRQLVADLKTLALMLRTSEKTFGSNSGWLFLDAADSLFVHARERVFGASSPKKLKQETGSDPKPVAPKLEICPKWTALAEVLEEIDEENDRQAQDPDIGPGRVLITAQDDRTCALIRDYLCHGGESVLTSLYNKHIANKPGSAEGAYKPLPEVPRKKKKFKDKGHGKGTDSSKVTADKQSSSLTLTQMIGPDKKSDVDSTNEPMLSSQDALYGLLPSPLTILHPLHGCSDPHGLSRTLHEIQPRFVVLYDPDIQFVRQLEVYRASRPGVPLRVYFLMYTGSAEEQQYLTTLRREKEAFTYLIREKAAMVVPEEREGKLEDDPNLSRDVTPANATTSTRKGGLDKGPQQHLVIVDMREFRSELPSLIHRRGIEIEPVTLEVGDYILTSEICVERKSVSDLIGSLNNGRLYNQCVSMCRFYKKPVLLIEFDPNKPFTLQAKYQLSSDVTLHDTTSRLALLTQHFPKLRILWCQSPYATAELFHELKMGRSQPDASTAMTVSAVDDVEWSDQYSHGPQDLLLKMPGVNSKNYKLILNKVHNLAELASLSLETIAEIINNSVNAKLLWDFLHTDKKVLENVVQKPAKPVKAGSAQRPFKRTR